LLRSAQSNAITPGAEVAKTHAGSSSLSTSVYWAFILAILVLLGSLNNNGSPLIFQTAKLPIVLVILLSNGALLLYFLLARQLHPYLRFPLIMSGISCGVYVVAQVLQGSIGGIVISVGQLVVLLGFYLHCSSMRWTNTMLVVLSWVFGIYCTIMLASWVAVGMPYRYAGTMTNANIFGSYAGFCLFFLCLGLLSEQLFINKLLMSAAGLICLVMIYNSGSRAILLGLLGAIITYMIWNSITKTKKRFQIFYLLLITLIAGFVGLYLYIQILPFGAVLDKISQELVGKTVYSPRLMIWLAILQKLSLKPMFGYGPYYIPKNLIDTGYSAHNVYLQVALQSGFMGLAALLTLLGSIWSSLWPGRQDNRVRLAGAFLVAIIIHQTFDVSLTQHNPAQALVMWLILGVGTGISLNSLGRTSLAGLAEGSSRNGQAGRFPPAVALSADTPTQATPHPV
jgi:O-antigen ligase